MKEPSPETPPTILQNIRKGLIIWLVMTVGFLLVTCAPSHFRKNYIFASDPNEGTAVITGEGDHGTVHYTYTVGENEYTGISQRNEEQAKTNRVREGETSVVYFSTSHPWISNLNKPKFPPEDTGWYVIIPVIFGIMILVAFFDRTKTSSSAPKSK